MTYGSASRPPAQTCLPDMAAAIPPQDVLRELVALDPAMTLQRYYGERAIFSLLHGRRVGPMTELSKMSKVSV